MIRDNYQLQSSIEMIRDAAKSGNKEALTDLPQQVIDLLDTLKTQPDYIINTNLESRVRTLEMDKRYLQDQVNIMTAQYNKMQDTLKEMGQELDKFHKIFDFLVSQKEAKKNVE